ncbi:hypothetical protein F4777DRAFT_557502 [Nemania sp. FL0916]|nr:hypothetical protein F4777DRAFT_557502 [Nemania sp. FL0916]
MSVLAPYAEDHREPNGPGDARPTALKVVRDQHLDGELAGKIFFVTGGTSGIGFETVRAIHATGADVYFTGRNAEEGDAISRTLARDGKPGKVEFLMLDLNSLASVRTSAAEFLKRTGGQLNCLICNAGIRGYPKGTTHDGFELHFGINHLGHFALFQALKDSLLASSSSKFASRVVTLSASGHRQSTIRFQDFNFDDGSYKPLLAYAQSKTANIYMAFEIERRYGSLGIHGLAVHPGGIRGTQLNRMTPKAELDAITSRPAVAAMTKSVEQGAASTTWAAVGREWEGRGGKFLEDCQESEPWDGNTEVLASGHARHIHDVESASRLWDESLSMIGQSSALDMSV